MAALVGFNGNWEKYFNIIALLDILFPLIYNEELPKLTLSSIFIHYLNPLQSKETYCQQLVPYEI